MSDDEPEEKFETTDEGSSHTYPTEAGVIRKGGFIMLKGNPCKVSDVSTSNAICHFVATDIFTGKEVEDSVPAGQTTPVPFVKKEELQCIDVDEDGFVTLLDGDGDTRSGVKLPSELQPEPAGAKELSAKIKEFLAAEKDFYVILQVACGKEQIVDTKIKTS